MSRRATSFGKILALLCLAAIFPGSRASAMLPAEPQQAASRRSDEALQVVSAFDGARGELPEGLTVDKAGNIYVSVGYPFWFPAPEGFGAIWKISPDGETITVLHSFPGGPGAAGLAVSPSGVLYYAYPNPGDPANGVYRLVGDEAPERLPGSENIALANGLALSKQGDLYVTDSFMGAVWRIPHDGGMAEIWIQHEWLAGCSADFAVGANGIALWQDSMYVASTEKGLIVRIPILKDGTPGQPNIVAGDTECDPEDELDGPDGIALDVHGNIFALLVLQHKLVRIDSDDGSLTVLLTADDGLFNPASIAFGTGKGNRQDVFVSNFALLPPEPANSLGAGVLKYGVGTPGLPLP